MAAQSDKDLDDWEEWDGSFPFVHHMVHSSTQFILLLLQTKPGVITDCGLVCGSDGALCIVPCRHVQGKPVCMAADCSL